MFTKDSKSIISEKTCSKCKNTYKLDKEFFPIDKRSKNGFSSHCRFCARAAARVTSRRRYAASKGLSLDDYSQWQAEKQTNREIKEGTKLLRQKVKGTQANFIVNGRII